LKLGLCILGCGSFAHTFSESLAHVRDEIDLYYASRELSRAESYSAEFNGAGAFGSYEEAVSDSRVDAVYICTPHDLHLEHSSLAAAAKKHILLEKPIARTVEEACEIIGVAKEAGVTLMIAENYRFLTAVQEAKQIIDSGVLGTIRLIQIQEEYPFEPSSWRNENGRNGGGVHRRGNPQSECSGLSFRATHSGICRDCPARHPWLGGGRRHGCYNPICQRDSGYHQPYVEHRQTDGQALGEGVRHVGQPEF